MKVQKGTKENKGREPSSSFFKVTLFFYRTISPIPNTLSVCVSVLVLQLFLCVSVGLFKVIHVSGFRGNIHCTLSSPLFSFPSQFTAGFGWKSSLVPHNARLKLSQTIFVRVIQILYIFHHSKNTWQYNSFFFAIIDGASRPETMFILFITFFIHFSFLHSLFEIPTIC